jgi:hypothetical protein
MDAVFVGSEVFGFWLENEEFMLADCVRSVDSGYELSLIHSEYDLPFVGRYCCGETEFIEFCEDKKIRTTSPIYFMATEERPTCSTEGALTPAALSMIGATLRSAKNSSRTFTGYFLGENCVILQVDGKIFHPRVNYELFPVSGDVVFCEKWPLRLSGHTGEVAAVAHISRAYPLWAFASPDANISLPKFVVREIKGALPNYPRYIRFNGEAFIEASSFIKQLGLTETKGEDPDLVPLDRHSKWMVGIEERVFHESKFYVVKAGEEFRNNKGEKTDYQSRPRIERVSFNELLEVYDDVCSVIWDMIFG